MTTKIENLLSIFKTAGIQWWIKYPFKESAVIAYYAIFSLPGLLAVVITVAGYFFGKEAVNGQITQQITSIMGAETALEVQNIIVKANETTNSVWAAIFDLG